MKNTGLAIWVMTVFVVVVCSGLPKAGATVNFNDGGQHIIDYAIYDDVYVDYRKPDTGTQVELVFGGSIYNLIAYENSQVAVSGGEVVHGLKAYDNSYISISAGEVYDLKSCDNSRVTVSGGVIGYSLWAYNSSQVTVSGGDIRYWLGALEDSRITVSGGKIGYGIYAGNPPRWDMSIITFLGINFAVNGKPVAYGDFASDYAVPGTEPGGDYCLTGRLTGTLADGGTLNKKFYIFDDADVTFAIPEPATLLLLGLGGLTVLRKRKS